LLVTPGVRFEHADFERIVTRLLDNDVQQQGDTSANGVIPGVGVIYGKRTAHVFAGLHEGWAPPRIVAAISPRGTPAQVSPERSINWELGSRWSPHKALHFELTGFVSKFQNQVVVNTAPLAGGESELDAGNTLHYGAEAAAVVGVGRLAHWRPAVDVGARYTYAHATFEDGPYKGNLLPYAPLHNFNANVDVEDPSGVGGQVAWLFVSNQYTDGANTALPDVTGSVGLMPAYNVLDLTAHYRHKPTGLTVRLTVKNALDDVYIVARRPNGIFTAGFRLILVGLRWDYDFGVKEQ